MKVLMLGPGEPSIFNSGLGVAVDQISQELSKSVELQIIQAATTESSVSESSTIAFKKSKHVFDEISVQQDLTIIDIKTNIPAYFYANLSDQKAVVAVDSTVKKSLEDFTVEMLHAAHPLAFDLVYAHDWTTILTAIALKKEYKKPYVLHIHSLDYDRATTLSHSWIFELEKEGMQLAEKVIAVSQYHADIMRKHYGIDSNKIVVIHHGIHQLPKVHKEKVFPEELVLFAGRLTGQKGPAIFLEIAALVLAERPNTRFVMAGSGELLQQLIESGANKGLSGKFHFTGQLDQEKLFQLYQMADLYCMPSVSEPFGLTAIEAAIFGLPMVLSKQSGASELLSAAKTAHHWDVETFAKKIVKLLDDPKAMKNMVDKNKELLAQRTWTVVSQEIKEVFEAVL